MRKKNLVLIAALAVWTVLAFCGCSDGNNNNSEAHPTHAVDETLAPPEDGYIRINTLSNKATNIWVWNDFDEAEIKKCGDWKAANGGVQKKGENGDYIYFDIKLAEKPQSLGFIIRSSGGNSSVSGSADIIFAFPHKYKEIFLKSGSGTIYVDKDCTEKPKGLESAEITGEKKITIVTQDISPSKDNVVVMNKDGAKLTITNAAKNVIQVAESLKEVSSVTVSYTDDLGTDTRTAGFSSSLIDSWFDLSGNSSVLESLGYKDGVFTTWAPTASKVDVLLFKDAATLRQEKYEPTAVIEMERNPDGTWTKGDVKDKIGSNQYYKYRITNGNKTYEVCDIWAKAASYESAASQIAEVEPVEYKNPWSGADYTDAVIYEMHITDWSQAFRNPMQQDKPGTFKEITAALGTNGSGKFAQHLKALGVTHVQILPMFEYAVTTKRTADGKVEDDNSAYNWGYNPYNWNTPESRYAKDMKDGTDAVKAMRDMVAAFHDAGIAVIMDVVYNHTNGTGEGSIYDMTVPGYFYRATDYSGCGNAVNTANEMVKTYVIESLKHWMKDYGINGFRFDLMGIHEKETMQEIYKELSAIDKNVMVYGEPWTGNGSYPTDGCNSAVAVSAAEGSNGVGAFDDDFRDAIKGAEVGGFKTGQVQGEFNDEGIANGLTGKSGKNNRNTTGLPGLALHYVECHDNFTLYDKLVYSLEENLSAVQAADKDGNIATKWPAAVSAEQIELIKKQNKLAAAYVILSQGTPFINGGQEFMRTKQGDPDSYAADKKGGVFWSNIDEVNAIDLKRKETYSDVYNTYKGLIALRKKNPEAFGANKDAKAETVSTGVTKYTTGDFLVYFSATDADFTLSEAVKGYRVTISEDDGTYSVASVQAAINVIPAKSFVILKK